LTHRVKVKLVERDGSDEIVIDERTGVAASAATTGR
jgi:hypothetical protein